MTEAYCTECGTALGSDPFCPNCGRPRASATEAAGEQASSGPSATTPELQASAWYPAAPAPDRSKVWLIAGATGLAAVGVIAVILAIVLNGTGSNAATAYRSKLASAWQPLVSANQQLSTDLQGLAAHSSPGSARSTARQVIDQTNAARTAMAAIPAGSGTSDIAREAATALDNETSYAAAVSATLANPTDPQASQLSALAATLRGAFSSLGLGTSPAAADSITGTDRLVAWAGHRGQPRSSGRHGRQQHPAKPGSPVGGVPPTSTCGSFTAQTSDGAFLVTAVAAAGVGCGEARAMIDSGPSGRGSSGWHCPLTGDKTFTSCTRGGQSVSWHIPGGGISSSPSGSGCGSFTASGSNGSFLVTGIQTQGTSCQEARSMIDSGPSGRAGSGWHCPLTGDKTFTSCTRGSQSVSWSIPGG